MSYRTCALLRAIEAWFVKPLPRKLESTRRLNAFDAIQTLAQRPTRHPVPDTFGSRVSDKCHAKRDYFAMQGMQLDKLIF